LPSRPLDLDRDGLVGIGEALGKVAGVVDRHQHRLLADEFGKHPDDGSRHGPRIGRLTAGGTQQRGGQRPLLRMRELLTRLVERRAATSARVA
jgi:hypothetical protein